MRAIDKIYNQVVNRNPYIRLKYQQYRKKTFGTGRLKAWGYLVKLNVQYGIFCRNRTGAFLPDMYYERKKLNLQVSESEEAKLESPSVLAARLAEYDVVSFDVFDTLIFRPFSSPGDLFHMTGLALGYMDFARIRREAEEEARAYKREKKGTNEVTMEEIWERTERKTGIPKDEGQRTEWECEKRYCFGNPYMLETVKELRKYGKRIIISSDMYLGERYIKDLLASCGYGTFDGYFISCELEKSKNEGELFEYIKKSMGRDDSYIHVGDNPYSDIKQAEAHGFSSFYYHNVNSLGEKYRAEDMSLVLGSIYRGLVNTHIGNGLFTYSKEYEFGFIYGGLFVLGYCRWIHQYVKENNVEKILFLARDGDILSQVYHKLYPKEREENKWEYVYWSRLAAVKMTAEYFKYDYFRRFLFHKTNQGYTLKQIFISMETEDMLSCFLKSYSDKKYREDTVLTDKNVEDLKLFLEEHWERILEHYKGQIKAGEQYFKGILKGCKKAAAVDVGWAGSGAAALNYLVNRKWNMGCEIIGLLAGTNSMHSPEPDASEAFLYSGRMKSYLFSQSYNRDVWKLHNPGKQHNVIVELLLSSDKKSFRGFSDKQGEFLFSKDREEINSKEVQRGILDFADVFSERMGEIPYISGRDGFAPIELLYENEAWVEKILQTDKFKMNLE